MSLLLMLRLFSAAAALLYFNWSVKLFIPDRIIQDNTHQNIYKTNIKEKGETPFNQSPKPVLSMASPMCCFRDFNTKSISIFCHERNLYKI